MALSQKTIEEMRAGAATVAAHASTNGIDPAYMEAMIRTQQRAAWLKDQQKAGFCAVVNINRHNTNDKTHATYTVVKVGDEVFDDVNAELTGGWPSEVLLARVALAISAGQGAKKSDG